MKNVFLGTTFLVGVAAVLGQTAVAAPITYTSYSQTMQRVQQQLPCKWMSTHPVRNANKGYYDFLCKGGNWGTVTLMLDKRNADELDSVKLIWRNWDPAVHPAGGEAETASQFVNMLLHHLVPQKISADVNQAFWGAREKRWRTKLVDIKYTHSPMKGYALHEMEIIGRGAKLPRGLYHPPTPPHKMAMMEDASMADSPMKNVQQIAEQGLPHQNRPQDITGAASELERKLLQAAPTAENVQNRMVRPEVAHSQMLDGALPQTVPTQEVQAAVKEVSPAKPQVNMADESPTFAFEPELAQDLASQQQPEEQRKYEANIRWQGDVLEINGLSAGKRALNTGIYDAKEGRVFEVLKRPESQLRVQPPPTGTKEYNSAAGLTEAYTHRVEQETEALMKELDSLTLTPYQAAPMLEGEAPAKENNPESSQQKEQNYEDKGQAL